MAPQEPPKSSISITVEPFFGDEEAFIPVAQAISFPLVPIEPGIPTFDGTPLTDEFLPRQLSEFLDFDLRELPGNPAVIDIETTGINPTKSRLICIGIRSANITEDDYKIFIGENEEAVVRDFMAYYVSQQYDTLVGFKTAFDYRYIFSRLLLYRIPGTEFVNSKIVDTAQKLAQVIAAFVPNAPKISKLNDWAKFLFDEEKLLSLKQLFEAWEKRDLTLIEEYNKQDVSLTYKINLLLNFVSLVPFTPLVTAGSGHAKADSATSNPSTDEVVALAEPVSDDKIKVQCPKDLSEHIIPVGSSSFTCPIDGTRLIIK